MRRFALVIALGALVAASAQAQEARKPDVADTAIVSRVDAAANRFWLRDDVTNRELPYRVDETTRILSGSKQLRLEDLKPGDRVAVSATHEGATPAETPVANVVSIVVEPPAGAAAPEPTSGTEPTTPATD